MATNFFILNGNSYDILDQFPDEFFDSVVTDSPYGLGDEPDPVAVLTDWLACGYHEVKSKGGFMGKEWDSFVPQPAIWRKVFRVLKPGGHLLSFFGTRTYDWGVMALRLAGFEVRDQIAWTYGEGMPKGMDVSMAIDKQLGADRSEKKVFVSGTLFDEPAVIVDGKVWNIGGGTTLNLRKGESRQKFAASKDPATIEAATWKGWNTALKPAWEPIVVCRKPLIGTVAANVLKYGTGALNTDACRIETNDDTTSAMGSDNEIYGKDKGTGKLSGGLGLGRWPANIAHDGSAEVLGAFGGVDRNPARFFYCGKASKSDRDAGLDGLGIQKDVGHNRYDKCGICNGYIFQNQDRKSACKCDNPVRQNNKISGNYHTTVKPTSLMRWLCRLVTPPRGKILDPFSGSGSTGKGAILEDFYYYGIELEYEMCEIARYRIADSGRIRDELKEKMKKTPELF